MQSVPSTEPVPAALRRWFVFHCVADVAFAVPMFLVPEALLVALGWTEVDPAMTRLVAAALFGIGLESWFGRNAGRDAFVQMLTLKVIWATAATVGLVWSAVSGGPPALWLFAGIFAAFLGLWASWRTSLLRSTAPG